MQNAIHSLAIDTYTVFHLKKKRKRKLEYENEEFVGRLSTYREIPYLNSMHQINHVIRNNVIHNSIDRFTRMPHSEGILFLLCNKRIRYMFVACVRHLNSLICNPPTGQLAFYQILQPIMGPNNSNTKYFVKKKKILAIFD